MTSVEKVKFLYEERAEDLNEWEHEFISDIYQNAQEDEELTHRQIGKIKEIWENMGL